MNSNKSVVGPTNAHILETEINGDISLYDPKTEQVSVLNGTASDIWRLADGTRTIEEITKLLASSYGMRPDAIADDVASTVERLTETGLIQTS